MTETYVSTELRNAATCPNCWADFSVSDVKWISAHEELIDDYRLGPGAQQRFLPTRFDANGCALDIRGMTCHELACPNCHLRVPRSSLVFSPFFVSIAGTPSCGKSFYLASMTWTLRQTLPTFFNLLFSDSDAESNQILNDYEQQLFFNPDKSRLVKLAKTEVVGDWYSTIRIDEQLISYPKPFFFDVRPNHSHQKYDRRDHVSRLLCLYDNAGESFLPGADTVANPVTRHLGRAEAWLFCYDLTQDPRFRETLRGNSDDYQITTGAVTARQEIVLNEMINRIRRYGQLGRKGKTDKPLIVVCTKFDAMGSLFDLAKYPSPWITINDGESCVLDFTAIHRVSGEIKDLLQKHCPELVAASEALSNKVYYIPVSATGCSPQKDPETGAFMMRTDQIKPVWCEVPFLLASALRAPSLVKAAKRREE